MSRSPPRAAAWAAACAACNGGEPDPEPLGVDVIDHGEVVCADPAARADQPYEFGELRAEEEKTRWFWGVGAVVADFDGDELLDVVLPGYWETMWFRGRGDGVLEEVPWDVVAPGVGALGLAAGGTAADYDGDSDLDLLVTSYLGSNKLLRNDGGTLVDVTEIAGLSTEPRRSMVSSWGDLDHDGDLDLYIGCYGYIDESGEDPKHTSFEPAEPDWLYLNNGDGTFADVSDRLPPEVHVGYALAGGFMDLDNDGWLDLYVVNDFGQSYPSRLLWNREGELVADANAHGLDVQITGMGVAVGDVNDDGIADLVMPAWNGNHALLSGAGGRGWFESVQLVGPINDLSRGQKIAWGGDLEDLDNDGDLDLPLSYGYLDSNYPASEAEADATYLQDEDGVFVDVGQQWGTNHPGATRGFATVDLDRDGFLDIVRRDTAGPTLVYTSRCDDSAWLEIGLRMPGANAFAVGARVTAWSGGRRQVRWVHAGSTNFGTGGPPEVHFGLGHADSVDRIEIAWPDGQQTAIEDLPTRHRWTFAR